VCSSDLERRADEATRDVVDWLKCEFKMDKVGEEFTGIVTGVTSFGLFVELQEYYVEGLIHVTSLSNDYYRFDPVKHCLVGERTRKSFRLGDKLTARVIKVNLDEKKIDFDLVESEETPNKKRKSVANKKANISAAKNKHKGKGNDKIKDKPKDKSSKKPGKKTSGKKISKKKQKSKTGQKVSTKPAKLSETGAKKKVTKKKALKKKVAKKKTQPVSKKATAKRKKSKPKT